MPVAVTAKAVRRAAPCCRCPFLLPAGRFPPFFAENTPHAHIRHTLFRRAAKCAPDTFAKRKKPGRMLRPGFFGAGDRDRTGTGVATHGILSPGRLPIPPHRQMVQTSIGLSTTQILYHRIGWMSIVNIEKIVFGGFFDRHSSPARRNEMLSRMAGDGAMTQ